MNKLFKSFLICFLSAILITSCSNGTSSSQNTDSPVKTENSSADNSIKDNTDVMIKKLADLYTQEHTLQIQKNNDKTYYTSSKLLTHVIADMLGKANEIDLQTNEGSKLAKGYDFQKYDYRLKFNGAKDIYFSASDNTLHFEGEKQLYKVWGDSKCLWENLTLDSKASTADLKDKGLEVMSLNYENSIHGDGTKDKISLVYRASKNLNFKGDLILRVNTSETVVSKDIQWQTVPQRTIYQNPEVLFLPQKGSRDMNFVVTLSWISESNDIAGDAWTYRYKGNEIQRVNFNAPETVFKYEKGNAFKVEFPEINASQEVRFNSSEYQKYLGNNKLKDLLSNESAFHNVPHSFEIKDYNGDGCMELGSFSSLMFEADITLGMGDQYVFYQCENDSIKPVKVIIAPPYDEKDKSVLVERELLDMMHAHGYLTLGDNGIEDSWFVPSKDYSSDDLKNMINQLVHANQLKKQGKKIFFNF